MVRRYIGEFRSYVGVSVGFGSAPGDTLSIADLHRLNSFKVGASGSLRIRPDVYWNFNAGWDSEDLPFDQYRNRFNIGTGVTKRF